MFKKLVNFICKLNGCGNGEEEKSCGTNNDICVPNNYQDSNLSAEELSMAKCCKGFTCSDIGYCIPD